MYDTASPTVLRFLTSSSGIRTPNFSSAFTTIVIMDSESMSRSSVKFLSGWTASVASPVSSLTISARPPRISCSLCAIGVRSFVSCGWGTAQATLRQPDHLRGVGQPRTEPDEQREAAVRGVALMKHALHGERNRRRRGVARLLDVVGHRHALGQLQLLDHGRHDPRVRLV